MIEKVNLVAGIAYWRETKDFMLLQLADSIEELGKLPPDEELVELLTFYLVFSMGLREMKLDEEASNFNKRSTQFMIGLERMGIKPGQYKNFVLDRMVDGLHDRIMNLASSRAAYRMLELPRESKPVEQK